ncbi:S-adenosyl-L-methionine-dependent methyltransferase [Collybia nuda]|uniref:DNA (cytosine-5-)-methyltransferase n=1 Tax=Collybia nuda TaxID=64659 RepID=A0A9P6CRG0_9AGAR|nr:S-adenosyl-L-methionine-dependent methyltransferase [Collybia nuda]
MKGCSRKIIYISVAYYDTRPDEIRETHDLVIVGEDFEDGYDPSDEDQEISKPIRVLTSFSIFDPRHRNEMVSLNVIEEEDAIDREFEAAGYVVPLFINEEDEGQEDGLEDMFQYVRLGAILRYTFDFTIESDPVYLETEFAWYILKNPSTRYQPYFRQFYSSRQVAQLAISTAIKHPQESYGHFLESFVLKVDIFGRKHQEEDLWNSVPSIQEMLEDYDDLQQIISTPLIKHLVPRALQTSKSRRPPRKRVSATKGPPTAKFITGNPDLAVLKPENQIPTHVTPLIAALAQGLVTEQLIVLGRLAPFLDEEVLTTQREAIHKRLCHFIIMAKVKHKKITVGQSDYYDEESHYLKTMKIGHEIFCVGDFIITPVGQEEENPHPFLPDEISDVSMTSTIADYFWFARIVYIDNEMQQVHVRWLEHGSQIFLEELAHPQELFFNNTCTNISFEAIVGKVNVHEICQERPKPIIGPEDFFVKFIHDKEHSTFTSIDKQEIMTSVHDPPYNCYASQILEAQQCKKTAAPLKGDQGVVDGVAYGGNSYHLDDFAFYRSESDGPAHIGYIIQLKFPSKNSPNGLPKICMQRVGRVNMILQAMPNGIIKDERHVFMTEEEVQVSVDKLIRVCFVFPLESIDDVDSWVALHPDHFYIRYSHPTLLVKALEDLQVIPYGNLNVCKHCVGDRLANKESIDKFLKHAQKHPLKTLDLFAGVGAFSHGLIQGSGCLKLTYAIEIGPSASATLRYNFPDAHVYNQCANSMLRYCIKQHEGLFTEPLKHLYDSKIPFPKCIKPGDIDVLVAGYPCQPHSDLNMYKKAGDTKSNLVLTALSWVEYLKPKVVYFENVPGFLKFSFDAEQAGQHRVEGGIPMGGMKFIVRALIDLGYQVRFGLLQAGNYGTPQGRVRLFIIAAVDGQPLPKLPEPSHDFPVVHNLTIKHPIDDEPIRPVCPDRGTAPHPSVTIDDAIGDLPRFDWKNPNLDCEPPDKQREIRERARIVPTLECNYRSPHCGFQGVVEYQYAAKTTYQVAARAKPTTDLQHFTKCLLPKRVERVVSIPLSANADYRGLRPDQYEWQIANPLSSVARKNYRPGVYGRLDMNGYFPTTVTNMDPTAKQCRVLNPYCKRMVTVRELARSQGFPDSFVFKSINDNVVTMHRQIGNAVPLPVGQALGRELRNSLHQHWLNNLENAIEIDDDD